MVAFNFDADNEDNKHYAWCPYKCGKILVMVGDNTYSCDYCDVEFQLMEKDDGIFVDEEDGEDDEM